MSKIICDVCGTSYAETASQCPICGCVRPADAQIISADNAEAGAASTYTYVKGGRFSKSNVRKRNKAQQAGGNSVDTEKLPEDTSKENRGLIITAVILLLAIIAVIALIFFRFILPAITDSGNNNQDHSGSQSGESTSASSRNVPCTDIQLDVTTITLSQEKEAWLLEVTALPADTTDTIIFSSSDPSVATVSADGKVIAVASGQATVRIKCGSITKECEVTCAFGDTTVDPTEQTTVPNVTITLNSYDFTLYKKGETFELYSGDIPATEITWTSKDEKIATVTNGKVEAVGPGSTEVYAEYNGQKVTCKVYCSFTGDGQGIPGSGGNITEDTGDMPVGPFKVYCGYSESGSWAASDISLKVGEAFSFYLKDSNGKAVSVTWSLSNGACTVSGNKVTAVSSGTVTLSTTYNGQSYECVIRVS